ncbi:type II toxin-antitoxin system PemK/MazF family toxin [Brevundimonas sp. Leaf363]|uniref:type II toxin-antitoxin system PemK/MazF family toxin n=1 Tax=Brevundimonas sp. Leaf363 TaxID=1736353 RepID=UPI0009EA1445|nr:type II toxin-antitoxin system PemK/MazF family toxin [Brevundimonas sp. Leaf363]
MSNGAPLKIKAAPKIRQMYWCDFRGDHLLPEMGKKRPVMIVSYRNTLHGIALVIPTSTDPQEGQSTAWAHKLSFKPDGKSESWLVCNHLYTVSTRRLEPLHGKTIPRMGEAEFERVMERLGQWLPALPPVPTA